MNCDNCNIEVQVIKVENKIFYFRCKKCGKEITMTESELNLKYKQKNKDK